MHLFHWHLSTVLQNWQCRTWRCRSWHWCQTWPTAVVSFSVLTWKAFYLKLQSSRVLNRMKIT